MPGIWRPRRWKIKPVSLLRSLAFSSWMIQVFLTGWNIAWGSPLRGTMSLNGRDLTWNFIKVFSQKWKEFFAQVVNRQWELFHFLHSCRQGWNRHVKCKSTLHKHYWRSHGGSVGVWVPLYCGWVVQAWACVHGTRWWSQRTPHIYTASGALSRLVVQGWGETFAWKAVNPANTNRRETVFHKTQSQPAVCILLFLRKSTLKCFKYVSETSSVYEPFSPYAIGLCIVPALLSTPLNTYKNTDRYLFLQIIPVSNPKYAFPHTNFWIDK